NGKVLARGGNRGSGDNVRVVVSRFGGVHGGADRSDFAEAYLRDRIEEPGINFESFGINDPGAGGDFDSRANRGDLAVANDQRSVFDGRTEIGRASCRERGEVRAVEGALAEPVG